ncbi:hexose transporter hxt1 [Pleurotus pulmonarius]|nr:hexose transporter hxt1 [Pleurotus pulmonarius]KAF4583781.1 hexose transporter hxt1 [Pleurotus pulmonarius]
MPVFYVNEVPIGLVAIMLALVASMGGFLFGYDTGQISDILLMDDFKLRFAQCGTPGDVGTCDFSVVRAGLIVSLLSIGTLVGALAGAPIADALGRRRAMIVECGVFIVGVTIQLLSFHSWQQFAVGRLVGGLGVGALSAAVPMYQAETAPSQIRGSWRIVVAIGIVWALILAIGMIFMPESPRWLAAHNRIEEARRSVALSRGVPVSEQQTNAFVIREVEQIREAADKQRKLQAGWLACFESKGKIRYRTFLGMTLQALQQLTGANYFFYYGATVFQSVGLADSFVTQIILGAVNFVCTFGGLWVLERYGRRIPLIIGGVWQSAWLFVFAAAGTVMGPVELNESISEEKQRLGKLMIVAACLFILGYALTWAPCVWILIGETFPTRTRAKQGALSASSNWLVNFLLAFFTPFIAKEINFRYGFVFAACNLFGAIVVYLFLYESSDLTLESVDDMYTDRRCKPWTSRSWAPEGYASREEYACSRGDCEKKVAIDSYATQGGLGAEVPSGDGASVSDTIGEKQSFEHRELSS